MRRLLLMIVSAFGVLLTQAQQVLDLQTGTLTDGVAPTVPTRDVETLPGGYRVSRFYILQSVWGTLPDIL